MAERSDALYASGGSFDATAGYGIGLEPVAGFYRMRLRSAGQPVGIKLWYGPTHDPHTGEEMDRGWRWQAHCNGSYIEFDRVWPVCASEPITEIEYNRMSGLQAWASVHAPQSQVADPLRKPTPLSTPLLF